MVMFIGLAHALCRRVLVCLCKQNNIINHFIVPSMDRRQNTLIASTNPAYGVTGESKNI